MQRVVSVHAQANSRTAGKQFDSIRFCSTEPRVTNGDTGQSCSAATCAGGFKLKGFKSVIYVII